MHLDLPPKRHWRLMSGKRNFTDWMEMRCLDAIQFDQRGLSGALEVACCMSYENGLPAPSNAELKKYE